MNSSTARIAGLVHDPDYPALKRHVIESTGLAYYIDKDNDLSLRLGARLSDLGLNKCGEYLRLLTNSEKAEAERHLLIAQLTIGETYFFRHSEQFDALRETVIPALIERNALTRRLRIWCAGCSTGPEPYSIAILLKEEFGEQLAGWDVQIIATDINQEFLAQARRGRFGEWAMRATSEAVKQRWFSYEDKTWVLASECREWLSFQYHNLVEHPFPSLVHNLVALDLILCRNVMIYFNWEVIRTIVDRFHNCLVDQGWLVVGHAEVNTEIFRRFRTVNAPNATLYRKDPEGSDPTENTHRKAAPTPAVVWTTPELPIVSLDPPARLPMEEPRQESAPTDGIAQIRRLADEGKWTNAIECCERLLLLDNLNPSIHFYRALILEQMGRNAECEQSLRRTIYLDRNFALAHYHLGLLLQKNGDDSTALQSLQNAARILSRMDGASVFEEADGMTVVELQELIAMQTGLFGK